MAEAPKSFFQKFFRSGDSKFNRNLGIYIVCLLLSGLLWLLISLSEKYDTDIVFPVAYSGIPKTRVITSALPETVTAHVNAGGFSLLWYKVTGSRQTINIDIPSSRLRELNGTYYTLTNNRLEKISAQLGDKIKVLRISPDTIFISFAEKLKRKLRVKPDLALSLEKQHGLSDSIKTDPEFVNVVGPKSIVEKMEFAETEKVSLKDVNDKQQVNTGFKKPDNSEGVTFSPETVKVIVPVEKYTEGTKDVAVTVRNLPKGSRLKVYPEKVKVTYLVGLSNFDKVDPAMFSVGFNYKNLPKGKSKKIKVELLSSPSFVNSVKVEPASVEYIIQK